MEIRIYNTLTKRVEKFETYEPGIVKMYVCGATVYDLPHIGHLRHEIVFDTFVNFLEWAGYQVKYVQNITDIEDKIIDRARDLGIPASELALRMTIEYFWVMRAARVRMPWLSPRATDHVEEMVRFIENLIEKGCAYVADGDVYFSVKKFEEYGKLSGQSLDALRVGARVEESEKKRSPEDFALWKSAKEGEPSWPSPWGRGRPGWHIECSVMSRIAFGITLDIHGGGTDLIFPHHENEIAQSESLTGKPLAKYWMHHGMVNLKGEKMSKSLKNVVYAKDILDKYGADAVRFYILKTYYRAPIEFDFSDLEAAHTTTDRYGRKLSYLGKVSSKQGRMRDLVEKARNEFAESMADDFNTPKAIHTLIAYTDLIYERVCSGETLATSAYEELLQLWNVLKIFAGPEYTQPGSREFGEKIREITLIDSLLEIREEERKRGNYSMADKIRAKLLELGVAVEDTKTGPIWYYVR